MNGLNNCIRISHGKMICPYLLQYDGCISMVQPHDNSSEVTSDSFIAISATSDGSC